MHVTVEERHRVVFNLDEPVDLEAARSLLSHDYREADAAAIAAAFESEDEFSSSPRGMVQDYILEFCTQDTWTDATVDYVDVDVKQGENA